MESFYGGRQGASFVIKKSFEYIDLLDDAFLADKNLRYDKESGTYFHGDDNWDLNKLKREIDTSSVMSECLSNTNYKDVWYNEYCIIDTTNKNNPNNGRIFRRVLPSADSNNLPYEEIGQIVGPSSGAALLKPMSGLEANKKALKNISSEWDTLGIAVNENGVEELKYISSGDASSITLKDYECDVSNGGLVAGYTKENGPVDKIKYNWFNVRNNTEKNQGVVESWCYIGFEIPYTVFTLSAAYSTPGIQPQVSENEDSKKHPFWYDLQFKIPGGLRGVSVTEIFTNADKEQADGTFEEITVYSFNQLKYADDKYSLDGEPKEKLKRKVWLCKLQFTNFNADKDATEATKEDAVFYISDVVEIKNVSLNSDSGEFVVEYYNKDKYTTNLRYPIDIQIDEPEGKVTTTYSCAVGDKSDVQTNYLRYPIKVDMVESSGHVTVEYSHAGDEEEKIESWDFRYPVNMKMDTGKGEITTTYSCSKGDLPAETTWVLDYPKTITFEKDDSEKFLTGKVTVDYSSSGKKIDQFGYVRQVEKYTEDDGSGKLKFVNTIEDHSNTFDFVYPEAITITPSTGKCDISYFGKSTETTTLPFVEAVKISPAHELLIAYTDNKLVNKDDYYPTVEEKNANGDTVRTYINYGQTIGTLGVMSGPMPSETDNIDTTNIDNIVDWYNSTHTNGQLYGKGDVSGKLHIVTTKSIGNADPISYFIMWDPDAKTWYIVSEIAGAPIGVPAQIGSDTTSWTYSSGLSDGYLQFVEFEPTGILNMPIKFE